jgi:hypothetical protein
LIERPVTEWFRREAPAIIDIFIGVEKISCTIDHPFWVEGKGWVEASQIKPGTVLRDREGNALVVDVVRRRNEVTYVYNVEIEGLHTYFVSESQILSHNACGNPANRAEFEKYKALLREQMEQPTTHNLDLTNIIGSNYREGATIGSGSTAAAVRQEAITGKPVGGRWHKQKAEDTIRAIEKWQKENPDALTIDKAAAENVLLDLKSALGR